MYAEAPSKASRVLAARSDAGTALSLPCTERPQPGQNALISGISAEQYGQIMRASGMILGNAAHAKSSQPARRLIEL
jgi:hypothetical protein